GKEPPPTNKLHVHYGRSGQATREYTQPHVQSPEIQRKLPGLQKTKVTICTYNARTLASEPWIEDLLMRAKK
ncbi:hypothetical protein Angca_001752, partial [Angiostrongylus cantonensis]